MSAILDSTNPLWKIGATVLFVGGVFAVTWLRLRLSRRGKGGVRR